MGQGSNSIRRTALAVKWPRRRRRAARDAIEVQLRGRVRLPWLDAGRAGQFDGLVALAWLRLAQAAPTLARAPALPEDPLSPTRAPLRFQRTQTGRDLGSVGADGRQGTCDDLVVQKP